MLTRVAPVSVALCRPETREGIARRSSDSGKRRKVGRNTKKTDSGLQKNRRKSDDDVKRTFQLIIFDAADRDPGSPTDFFRPESHSARSDQQGSMPSVELGRRKRRWSGEGTLERPLRSRKPQGVSPSAERDEGRGGGKAVFDMQDYIQTLEDHKEKIAPMQVFYDDDDDGRVVGTWRGRCRIDLPEYHFEVFYGVDRVPSIGSCDPSMRRTHCGRFSGAGQCGPSQTDEQSSQTSIMHSTIASRTVASEDKADIEDYTTSGNIVVGLLVVTSERHQPTAGDEQTAPKPAGSGKRE